MLRRPSGKQEGAALVEFGIILPVLLILLFGLWEFGRIFDAWLVVTNASREGARYAVTSGATTEAARNDEVRAKVRYYVKSGYGDRWLGGVAGDIHDYIVIDVTGPIAGGPVSVVVEAAVEVYAPIVANLTNPFTVTARSVMRK